jgi:hypothetical protein
MIIIIATCILLATLFIAMVEVWKWLYPHLSPDVLHIRSIYHGAVEDGTNTYKSAKNIFELLNLLSGPALVGIAIIAGFVAYFQFNEAKRTRTAEVYMRIVEVWNSAENVTTRKLLYDLAREFENANQNTNDVQFNLERAAYICDKIAEIGKNDQLKERNYLLILYLFEDLGILCRKKYIKKEDMLDFIGEHIITIVEFHLPYIKKARKEYMDETMGNALYANAVYLYRLAKTRRNKFYTHALD